MPLDLRTELDALARSLAQANIPYAVCGALALAVHGHPRATKDIDLITPPEYVAALKAVARVHGFTIEALPMSFAASGITVHRISRLVGAQILTLDIIEGGGTLEPVWATRERHATAGEPLWVVSRQGLITMKLAAGRPQDIADLARLEGSA